MIQETKNIMLKATLIGKLDIKSKNIVI